MFVRDSCTDERKDTRILRKHYASGRYVGIEILFILNKELKTHDWDQNIAAAIYKSESLYLLQMHF